MFGNTKRCDHCGQMDFRNAKLTKMLSWLCNRLDWPSYSGENHELDSWWKDHKRAFEADVRRQAEEQERQRKVKAALTKLSDEEKVLLGVTK